MNGFDLDLIARVSEAVNVPVVAAGGAGNLEHFQAALDAGAHSVSAGSMFVYHGPHRAVLINYPGPEEISKLIGFGDSSGAV
jgi:cyclase